MKYDNLGLFEKYLEERKNSSSFLPLFFFIFKENFECLETIHSLCRTLLPNEHMREHGLFQLDASQMNEHLFWDALYAPSFLIDSKVIWVQNAEKLKKSTLEKLEAYFLHPSPSTYLILSASSWSKQTNFYKAIEWVNKQLAAEAKTMTQQACRFFVNFVGHDQSSLASELEKLFCYCSEKKEIQQRDVEAICTSQHTETIWQLGEALFRRDVGTAIQISKAFLLEGQALLPLIRQIRSQFQTGYQISLLLTQNKGAQEITQEFPYMKGQILERNMKQARQFGVKAYKEGLIALEAAETRIKNTSIDEEIAMELLIYKLCK